MAPTGRNLPLLHLKIFPRPRHIREPATAANVQGQASGMASTGTGKKTSSRKAPLQNQCFGPGKAKRAERADTGTCKAWPRLAWNLLFGLGLPAPGSNVQR